MKKYTILIFLVLIAFASRSQILPKPANPTLVTDNAHLLTSEQIANLEQRLVALDDSTSNQIAIVTIPTLGNMALEEYANKMLRDWGIGTKKNNNGILILVAAQDHKIRIEVGSGLEGAIPDVTANSIIENDLTPNFKANNYYAGLDQAITSLGQAATGEYHVQRTTSDNKRPSGFIFL